MDPHPTGDDQVVAGDVAGRGRREEGDGLRDVGGGTDPAEGDLRTPGLDHVPGDAELAVGRGVDQAGADGVDAYAARREFQRQRTHHREQRTLGGGHGGAEAFAGTDGDHDRSTADVWEVLRAGIVAVLALHESHEQALKRFRLLHNTASLRAGWLEKRLRFQDELLPLITPRMDGTELAARAVIATAFVCLDAATIAWVGNDGEDGEDEVMDLYDACLAAVRG